MCYSSLNMIDSVNYTENDLNALGTYVLAVLDRMAENRDIMSDPDGMPVLTRFDVQRTDTRLRVNLEVDASAIGMPINTPIVAIQSKEHPDHIAWMLDDRILIATTPVDWSPERVADEALEMNNLLAAHAKWFGRSSRGRGR